MSQQISITRFLELEDLNLECMWLWARPPRLPRPLSAIAVCVVYNPPDKSVQEQRELCDYLVSSIDTIRSKYPDCGIVVLGDFNHLNIQDLVTSHNLKQVVTRPTRQDSILDYIITNLKSFYKTPNISAPLGTSDHNVIMWIPKDIFNDNNNTCIKRTVRRYPQSGLNGFGLWSTRNKWFSGLGLNPSSDELASSFTNDMNTAFDHFFPVNTITFHPTDKPWITGHIKQLIKERQRAFHTGDAQLWRQYRRRVQIGIKIRKNNFYTQKIHNLRKDDVRQWWHTINTMSGRAKSQPQFTTESLNDYFVSVASDIPPLDIPSLPTFLPAAVPPPTIHPREVCSKLLKIQTNKAMGPDSIPPRILKEFAYELAEPVTSIFNISLSSGLVPVLWKDSSIIPIPKAKQTQVESDTRPIALTPVLSKVLEDFVVSWMVEDIGGQIDNRQYGSLKGTSTTLCLLDLIHNWLSKMDNPGHYLRACFLDFSKAFDRIDHNIVITKLIDLGVRRSIIPWICSFLSNRRQCVELGQCVSRWLSTSAGVPQCIKLGPILFVIMINDLKIVSPRSSNWKYVDDVTISEIVPTREVSILQNELDAIGNWTSTNNMKLNPKKCKEMIVSFRRDIEQPPPTLVVENISLERIESHKVLGLTIQNNLKWDLHISEMVTKASKRLHILRVLKRSGVSPFHLLRVHFALIRSLLEYCCPVWHSSLTINLSDKIERVQKRTMRIIYPILYK